MLRIDVEPPGEANFAFLGVNTQDADFELFADLDDVLGIFDLVIGKFGDVEQSFEIVLEFDEDSEIGDFCDLAVDGVARGKPLRDVVFPRVLFKLLQSESNPPPLLVDGQDLAGDFVAFFQQFAGVSDLASPGHVADVKESIDALFQFDESTVIGEVADFALHGGSWRVLGCDIVPGIGGGLLHSQGDFLFLLVDAQNDDLHLVTDIDQFGGVIDALGPGHLADVDESFDAVFEFDKCPIGHDVDDLAGHARIDGELVLDAFPRAGGLLFEAEGDFLFFTVDVEDHHLNFLVDFDHVRGMIDPGPAHVGDVKKPVDPTEIDESAKVGDVFDDASPEVALRDL